MNGQKWRSTTNEELSKTELIKVPMNDFDVLMEARHYGAPEQVIVETEVIWLQVNQ